VEPLPSRVNCEWRPNFTYGGQPIEGSLQSWESVLSYLLSNLNRKVFKCIYIYIYIYISFQLPNIS
jgi:hypothetical protein